MASWNKETLPRENGELVQMQVPEIVSASRSTDIPAFYADWFFHRLKVGYSVLKVMCRIRIRASLYFGQRILVHCLAILII